MVHYRICTLLWLYDSNEARWNTWDLIFIWTGPNTPTEIMMSTHQSTNCSLIQKNKRSCWTRWYWVVESATKDEYLPPYCWGASWVVWLKQRIVYLLRLVQTNKYISYNLLQHTQAKSIKFVSHAEIREKIYWKQRLWKTSSLYLMQKSKIFRRKLKWLHANLS